MAAKNLNIVEQHVEKGVLGVGVLFLAGVLSYYALFSPNKIEFKGEHVGGRELDDKLLMLAEDLDRKVKNASEKPAEIPNYASQLRAQLQTSILEPGRDDAPAMPKRLPLAANWGTPIPSAAGSDESGSVAVVSPMKTTRPAVRTGRSLALVSQAKLTTEATAQKGEPAEVSWVSIGAYWPLKAQEEAIVAAKYPSRYAKAYVGKVEVQRQELLSNGAWTEWQLVTPGRAMPEVDVPDPSINAQNGEVSNRNAIEDLFDKIRGAQHRVVQPPFYDVEKGDEWRSPLEDDPIEEDAPAPKPKPKPEPQDKDNRKAPPTPPLGPRDGGGGSGGRGRGGIGGDGGSGHTGPLTPPVDPKRKKEAEEALKAAEKAFRESEWDLAKEKAEEVLNNESASKDHKSRAEKVAQKAGAKIEERDKETESVGPRGRGVINDGGPGFPPGGPMRGRGGPDTGKKVLDDRAIRELLKMDAAGESPEVWFHDDGVEPGKTYRYRMRVRMVNRFAGKLKSVADPELAKVSLLPSEWSDPSDPISVVAPTQFYAKASKSGDDSAVIAEVFRWVKGAWLRSNFDVRLGDIVGFPKDAKVGDGKERIDFTTGSVVIDIRPKEKVTVRAPVAGKPGEFSTRDAESVVVTYVDGADGQVKERIAVMTSNDPMYKKMKKTDEESGG